MQIHCPKCGRQILGADLNAADDVAVCKPCNEAFVLSELLDGDGETGGTVAAATDADLTQPPRGAWFREEIGGFEVGATTRAAGALFLVPFTAVWAGGSMTGIYGTQIFSGKFQPGLSLFGIPFALGSLFLVSMTLMTIAGRVVARVRGGEGTVFTGVGPIGRTKRFDAAAVTRVSTARSNWQSNGKPMQQIVLDLGSDKSVKFGSGLSDTRREYLARVLRGLLVSKPVSR